MKRFLILLLFVPLISFGQNITYSKSYSGKTVAKDQFGNVIANGEKDFLGAVVWKDQYGNVIKKETIDYLGRNVSKDNKGNTISTGKNNYLGEYVEKDLNGNVIAKYKRNYLGEVEKKDQYGNIIGKYKYTYDGNLEYQTQEISTYSIPNNNSGPYSNPKIILQEPYQPDISSNKSSKNSGSYANPAMIVDTKSGQIISEGIQSIGESIGSAIKANAKIQAAQNARNERIRIEKKKIREREEEIKKIKLLRIKEEKKRLETSNPNSIINKFKRKKS